MTINNALTVVDLVKIAKKNDVSFVFIVVLYIIACGDETSYKYLLSSKQVGESIINNMLLKGYTLTNSLDKLPIITKKTVELFASEMRSEAKEPAPMQTVEQWIDEYRKLFRGKKNGAMGDKNTCIAKMRDFIFKNPQYSKDDILKATAKYIASKSEQNYLYLRQADYFIKKQVLEDGSKIFISDLLRTLEEMQTDTEKTGDNQWHGNLKIG
jgi:hypothetical protein